MAIHWSLTPLFEVDYRSSWNKGIEQAYYTALPRQNRLTDIFDKIEFLPLIGSEYQYLPMKKCKIHKFTILNPKKFSWKSEFCVQVNGRLVE